MSSDVPPPLADLGPLDAAAAALEPRVADAARYGLQNAIATIRFGQWETVCSHYRRWPQS